MDKNRHLKKETILKALESSLGVVTTACKKTNIPRSTFYKWLKEDEDFAEKVKDIEKQYVSTNAFESVKEEFEAIAGIVELSGTWAEVE